MSLPENIPWLLDRSKVRTFVARERKELDDRVERGELLEHIQIDQREAFLDVVSRLPDEQAGTATDLYIEEKKALYAGRVRIAEELARAAEESQGQFEKDAEEIGRSVGIILGALVIFGAMILFALLLKTK